MAAIWMRVRGQLRARWSQTIAMTLLIGLLGGVVLTAAAGARRTDTAYPRFLEWSHPADATVIVSTAFGFTGTPAAAVRNLPEVRSTAPVDQVGFVSTTPSGKLLFIGQGAGSAAVSSRDVGFFGRSKVLEGRMYDPTDVHQIVVGWGSGHPVGVHPGDSIVFRFLRRGVAPDLLNNVGDPTEVPAKDLTSPFTATVAGIVFFPGDVGDNAYGDVLFTPAFDRAYRNDISTTHFIGVRLRRGAADSERFQRDVEALAHRGTTGVNSSDSMSGPILRATHPQAVALWIFAALAALAGVFLFAQALARLVFVEGLENPTLRALGMRRSELLGVALLRVGIIGLGAAAVAVVVAIAASPMMPIGLARIAEPNPGVSVDATVIGIGGLAIVGATLLIAAFPAVRMAGAAGSNLGTAEIGTRARPSIVAGTLSRAGLAPSAVAGTRMAFEPGRGRTAVPVRSALAGTALAVAALTAALTFATSFQHLFDTPRLYGWNWDAAVGNPFTGDVSRQVLSRLPDEPYVGAVAAGNVYTSVRVGGPKGSVEVNAFGLDPVKGSVHPPVVSGRWPEGPGEVALGPKTLRAVGASVGSRVDLRAGDNVLRGLRVVGAAVFVDVSGTGLGEGAGFTFRTLRRLVPQVPENVFPVRYAPNVDRATAAASITRDFPGTTPGASDEVSGLGDLRPVKGFPLLLAVLLAVAAVLTIVITLVTAIRRRRRDLAILKTIGFVRRQVSVTVAWQATALVVTSLLVGLPLGIAGGRWVWSAFAGALGVVPESKVPLGPVLLLIPAAILVANLVGLVPGRLAGRIGPAGALRTE